jgi:hypothetical protein
VEDGEIKSGVCVVVLLFGDCYCLILRVKIEGGLLCGYGGLRRMSMVVEGGDKWLSMRKDGVFLVIITMVMVVITMFYKYEFFVFSPFCLKIYLLFIMKKIRFNLQWNEII